MLLVIMIPTLCDYDIHICGACKSQFGSLENFMQHKLTHCQSDTLQRKVIPTTPDQDPSTSLNSCVVVSSGLRDSLADKSVIVRNEPMILKRKLEQTIAQNEEHQQSLLISNEVSDDHNNDNNNTQSISTKKKLNYCCYIKDCNYASRLKKDVERHYRTHTGVRPFKCCECEKTFTRNDKRLAHERIHFGEKKYKCKECDYAAVDSSSLTKHHRIHSGLKPYKCQLCPYCARSQSQLTVHLRMHTGDAPYVCTHKNCSSAFRTTTDLKRHAAVHSNVKPNACQYCSYRTAFKRCLVVHIRKQHPNGEDGVTKYYSCCHCSATFRTSRKLSYHIKGQHFSAAQEPPHNNTAVSKAANSLDNIGQRTKLANSRHPHLMTRDKYQNSLTGRRPRLRRANTRRGLNRAYECPDCHASFVSPANLHIHEMHHMKNRPVCTESDRTSGNPGTLLDALNGSEQMSLGYLESGQLDTNRRTAEMLASLAGDLPTRPYNDDPPDFFPPHAISSTHGGMINDIY